MSLTIILRKRGNKRYRYLRGSERFGATVSQTPEIYIGSTKNFAALTAGEWVSIAQRLEACTIPGKQQDGGKFRGCTLPDILEAAQAYINKHPKESRGHGGGYTLKNLREAAMAWEFERNIRHRKTEEEWRQEARIYKEWEDRP